MDPSLLSLPVNESRNNHFSNNFPINVEQRGHLTTFLLDVQCCRKLTSGNSKLYRRERSNPSSASCGHVDTMNSSSRSITLCFPKKINNYAFSSETQEYTCKNLQTYSVNEKSGVEIYFPLKKNCTNHWQLCRNLSCFYHVSSN